MTEPIALRDVRKLPPEALIYAVTGTLKTLYGWKQGTNAKGDWTLQNGVLEQDGVEMPILLTNRDEELSKSWVGREILIESHHGSKGWNGAKAVDDDYNGKVERKIKVTGTGKISLVGGSPAATKQEPKSEPKTEPRQQQEPADPPADEPAQPKKSRMAEAVEYAIQDANLALLAINTVYNYIGPRVKEKTGIELDSQALHAWAMNLKIDMQKKGYESCMPKTRVMDKPAPQQQQPPPKPPQTEDTGEAKDADGNYLF